MAVTMEDVLLCFVLWGIPFLCLLIGFIIYAMFEYLKTLKRNKYEEKRLCDNIGKIIDRLENIKEK